MTVRVYQHEISSRVYWVELNGTRRMATENLTPGSQVYGEMLLKAGEKEYRVWDPYRSKLGAAIMNGLKKLPIGEKNSVLYLGAASGTTSSHVSDIVGVSGHVFCVDISPRPMRDLISVCSKRENMIPIIADARLPHIYAPLVKKVDVVYQDIAQPDQTEIMLKNSAIFLKKSGYGMLAIKTRSIDVTRDPDEIVEEEIAKLESHVRIVERVNIHPYEKDHAVIVFQMK
ncbi:MAG: fibrillarin-like rRNA/tRNA 2'-O-methyltransferase [Candidatus Hadarchaeales archaeon]